MIKKEYTILLIIFSIILMVSSHFLNILFYQADFWLFFGVLVQLNIVCDVCLWSAIGIQIIIIGDVLFDFNNK